MAFCRAKWEDQLMANTRARVLTQILPNESCHEFKEAMGFGLCNAPGTFQRCMLSIFSEYIEKSIEVFMDDFSVFGDSFDACLGNLEVILQRCVETNLVLNWEKCHFMVT